MHSSFIYQAAMTNYDTENFYKVIVYFYCKRYYFQFLLHMLKFLCKLVLFFLFCLYYTTQFTQLVKFLEKTIEI